MNPGDTVKVKGTIHITTIKEKSGGWYVLNKPHMACCNYYGEWELELIPVFYTTKTDEEGKEIDSWEWAERERVKNKINQ